ncbi:MAG: FAD-dependent oxidoreductase [Acidimicrobiales bacterium]
MPFGAVTIVGGSLAGLTAAQTLRGEGFDGTITVVEPELGDPYDRPPLSKEVLAGTWGPERVVLGAAKADLDLTWERGHHAVRLDLQDRSVQLGDGRRLPFETLVLATGATPRTLPGAAALGGVHVLRTLDDCLALRADLDAEPDRVVVVGAGFIGAEVAATCRGRGLPVTVLEAAPVPLERVLGAAMGAVCADLHRSHDVDLRLGVGVDHLVADDGGRVRAVALADGSVVEASVVVVGIGVAPRIDWLAGSGLTIDDGVVCDEHLRAAPGIVAVGDIVRWPSRGFGRSLRLEHWEHAVQSGEAAARTLLAEGGLIDRPLEAYDPVPWFWSDQYDRKIQLAGLSGPDDRVEVVIGDTAEHRFVALYGRDDRVVAVLGMNRPRHVMQLRALVAEGASFDEGLARARELA